MAKFTRNRLKNKITYLLQQYFELCPYKLSKKYDADIIWLQELDSKNRTLLWMDLINNNKYKLFYLKHTNKKQDGLLLAYKHSKYKQY